MSKVLDVSKVVCYTSNFPDGSNLGYGMVTFNDVITIKFNIKRAGSGNLFVSWPSRAKDGDGKTEYTQLVTFEDQEARNSINNVILEEFNKKLNLSNGAKGSSKQSSVTITASAVSGHNDFDDNDPPFEIEPKKPVVKWKRNK